ncbi:MAG: helix-turn-helix transcriptional regulator [Candidatus Neomarinimicrobiota bacterium]
MKSFLKKYKAQRNQQGIKLEEIHSRTKISLAHLEALEQGNFDILPPAYIRLFFRAYVTEIGADPEAAMIELDKLLATDTKKPTPEEPKEVSRPNNKDKSNKTVTIHKFGKQNRSNLIKGLILLIIWIFAIIIIRKITLTDGIASIPDSDIQTGEMSYFLRSDNLNTSFQEISTADKFLEIDPPYQVLISSTDQHFISVTSDSSIPEDVILVPDNPREFAFGSYLDIILNRGNGIELHINGESLDYDLYLPQPIRVTFRSDPFRVTVKHFSPLQ